MTDASLRNLLRDQKWVAALDVMDVLLRHGYQAYLVGGAVRDLYLKRDIVDIDIATDAVPQTVLGLFPRAIATAPQHGTVTIPLPYGVCEVTTFRTDGAYGDGRRPDEVRFGHDLVEDLARRDFTMNAMALSSTGEHIDPFAGELDLRNRTLRVVGDASERFAEDALRMLRAFRFASVYQLQIETRTYQGIVEHARAIVNVSRERIGTELRKFSLGHWELVLASLVRSNLFRYCDMPLSSLQIGLERLMHYLDAAADVSPVSMNLRGDEAFVAWFLLVEDGAAIAEKVCQCIALGKVTARRIKEICSLAERLLAQQLADGFNLTPFDLYASGVENATHAIHVVCCMHPAEATRLYEMYRKAVANQPLWSLKDLKLDGSDLFQLGARGRKIGQVLQELVNMVLAGSMENEQNALLRAAQAILNNGG